MVKNVFGFGPMGILPNDAAQKTPDPAAKKADFEMLASKSQIPVNILMALDEQGADVGAKATEISGWVAGGRKIEEVVPPEVMSRAYDIADALYPRAPEPEKPSGGFGEVASDLGRTLAGAAVTGFGGAADALGAYAEGQNVTFKPGEIEPTYNETRLGKASRAVGGAVSGVGDSILAGVSDGGRKAQEGSTIGGDITSPSTWDFGDDPSLRGFAMQAANVFGSFLPVVATAVVTKSPVAAGAVGGGMGGGAASQSAREIIQGMEDTKGEDGESVLYHESAFFRGKIASGATREDALKQTMMAAEQEAVRLTTPISALGGAVTGKILAPGISALAGKGIATRMAGTAVASALEEGSQEVAETIATRSGINKGAGTNLNTTEGTFGDFILGAIGGAGPAAVSGAFNGRDGREPPAPDQFTDTGGDGSAPGQAGIPSLTPQGSDGGVPAANEGAAAPMPDFPGLDAVDVAPGPEAPPLGPLASIAEVAPDLTPAPEAPPPAVMFPDQKPGSSLKLVQPDTGVLYDAVFLREIPGGVVVRIDGGEVELDGTEFDQARILAAGMDKGTAPTPGAAPVEAVKPAEQPTAITSPTTEVGAIVQADIDRSYGMAERLGVVEAIEDAAANGMTARQTIFLLGKKLDQIDAIAAANNDPIGAMGEKAMLVRAVRSKLGIPSTDEKAEFTKWQADYNARKLKAVTDKAKSKADPAPVQSEKVTPQTPSGIPPAMAQAQGDTPASLVQAAKFVRSISAAETALADAQTQLEREPTEPARMAMKKARKSLETLRTKAANYSATLPAGEQAAYVDAVTRPFEDAARGNAERVNDETPSGIQTDAAVANAERVPVAPPSDTAKAKPGYGASNTLVSADRAAEMRAKLKAKLNDRSQINSGIDPEMLSLGTELAVFHLEAGVRKFVDFAKAMAADLDTTPKALRKYLRGWYVGAQATMEDSGVSTDGMDAPGAVRAALVAIDAETDEAVAQVTTPNANETKAEKPPGATEVTTPATPTVAEIKTAAAQADTKPTDAQKEAGNYQMGHVQWNGLDITIETAKGKKRSGKDSDGEAWSVTMPAHYGYIKRTTGTDGDHVDIYMGDYPDSDQVYVIDQKDAATGAYDEHKVMLGFRNRKHAFDTYVLGFNDGKGRERLGGHKIMSVAEFKDWLANGDTTAPVRMDAAPAQEAAPAAIPTPTDAAKTTPDAAGLEAAGMERGKGDQLAWFRRQGERGGIAIYRARAIRANPDAPYRWALTRDFRPEGGITAPPTRDIGKVDTAAEAVAQLRENGMRETPADLLGDAAPPVAAIDDAERIARRDQVAPWSIPAHAMKQTLTEDEAREFGKKHFADGYKRLVPPKIRTNHGEVASRAWYEGWDKANIDAPMPDDATEVQTPQKPAIISAPSAKETTDEQPGNQSRDQSQLDSEQSESGVDQESGTSGERADDGRGKGDEADSGTGSGDESGGSLVRDPGRVSDAAPEGRVGTAPPNFTITDGFALGEGTDGQKITANIAALRLVKDLEAENRFATPEEQSVLAKWVGWGGLKTVFDEKHSGTTGQYGRAQADLKGLLSTTEYFDAMRSTADAHYTSRTVVDAMWNAMRQFGFTGGRALEPTIGSGNFVGLQPSDMNPNTEWFASELDPTTGLIAKHLYPKATIFDGMGFQDAPFRRGTFDIAIGNPPFGGDSSRVGNSKMHPDLGRMKVHNFVIAKTGQLLREGGIMGMVVTHRFLDAMDTEARDTLAPNFHFVGAIRLPNTAFKANAGTEVTTDIIFFQKRKAGDMDGDVSWQEVGADGPNGTKLNAWFAANPDMILGRPAMDGTMYAARSKPGEERAEFTVHDDGRDLADALAEAVGKLKATLSGREQALEDAVTAPRTVSTLGYMEMTINKDGRIFRGEIADDGSRYVEEVTEETFWKDGAKAQSDLVDALNTIVESKVEPTTDQFQEARDAAAAAGLIDLAGEPITITTKFEQALADALPAIMSGRPTTAQRDALDAYAKRVDAKKLGSDGFKRLSAILDLREKTKALIRAEIDDTSGIEQMRGNVRNTYKAFVNAYGFLNNPKNEAILLGDVGAEMALESRYVAANKDGRVESAEEAAILTKRVRFPHKLPENMDSVNDALFVSMQEKGYIDPVLIAQVTNRSIADVVSEITAGESPMAFRNPANGRYELAEIYLSGNLAEKITQATESRAFENIPHLKAAMPPPKTQDQITPSIRSMWIPGEVFEDFVRAMGYATPKVMVAGNVGQVMVSASLSTPTEFGEQFKTRRMDALEIFQHAVKGKIPVVYDSHRENGKDVRVKNEEDTREAVASYERMSAEFPAWAFANPQRASTIIDAFNTKMNVVTSRKYDGVKYLRVAGASPEVMLRNSQKNGAWRMIQDKVTLLHHVVGAGKTMTGITGIMERRRMGLTKKAVVVVPNHLTGQWGKEWLELYPGANILVPTEKDFTPQNRAKLINRIATGDFDAVVIGHSQLTKIANDPEATTKYIEDEMSELNSVLQAAKKEGTSKRSISQIAQRIQKLREKLKALNDKLAENLGSGILPWHELGVDYLLMDESQEFKNLEYSTTATNLVGMNPPGGSQRGFDLLMKLRTIQAMPNGGVAFMTGTPISNSLVEVYTLMKYLIPESMDSMGIKHFDAFKAAFIKDESRFEYTASMQLKERNVMSGLINLGPMAELYRSFADLVMRPDVERMYTEQMEAKNAAEKDPSKHVSTRFPTPRVKDGGRRILLAPPTANMTEFTQYLVMRMAGIKNASDKKAYAKTDNPLWVLTDARKASVDIRTIDPTLGREEGSKVLRSSDEVFRIWKANGARNGAQMVFCDMSTPSKNASKDAAAIIKAAYGKLGLNKEDLQRRIAKDEGKTYAERWGQLFDEVDQRISSPDTEDKKRDDLQEWMESPAVADAAAAMFTADTGFSFYDDMKEVLIEKGIPADQIAFIHDYNTTIRKSELFDMVNSGKIRVLLGSTVKMGAGTNAQRRLVALHHIDAPWRPSDMEQREGRIIRQGNLFYEQDPDGFEVEILAYSTEKTADVVQWQVLARKAKSIETVLNAAVDNVDEEGGDADQYAEFMAQSTGKKVFLQKMESEKALGGAIAEIASAKRSRSEAQRFIASFDEDAKAMQGRIDGFSGISESTFPAGAFDYLSGWHGEAEAYRAAKATIQSEQDAVRKANEGLPRKDHQKIPQLPPAPKRWTERPRGGWDRQVYDVLEQTQANPRGGPRRIKLAGGAYIEVHGYSAGDGSGIVSTTAYLGYEGDQGYTIAITAPFGIAAKDFRASDKLVSSFDPAHIVSVANERTKRIATSLADHKATLPKMEAVLAKTVDESKVNKLEVRVAVLTALSRIEEVKFAAETMTGEANHFAMIDDKGRNLESDKTAEPITGSFQFANAGKNYASEWGAPAGRMMRIEGTDKSGAVAFFEADDMDTNTPVVVEAVKLPKENAADPDRWDVLEVYDYPDDVDTADMARFDPDGWGEVEADSPATEADIQKITKDMNAEIARSGLGGKINVRVSRELFSRTSGQSIYGRFDPIGRGRGTVAVAARRRDAQDVAPIDVMRHEIIHALRSDGLWAKPYGLFTEAEWRELVRTARAEGDVAASVLERYPTLETKKQSEEMVAELYRLWAANRDGYSKVERTMAKVEAFLTALANVFRGRGFNSAALTMERIASGNVGGRGPQGPGAKALANRPSDKVRAALGMEMRDTAADEVKAAWEGSRPDTPIVLGRLPDVFRSLTGKDNQLVISASVVRKAGSHGLVLEDVTAAIEGLGDPVMVFDSTNGTGNLTALIETKAKDGRALVVAVDASFTVGRVNISRIATIHGKDNAVSVLGWMRDGYLRYINKQKAGAWARSIGRQLPKDMETSHRLGSKILLHSDVFKTSSPDSEAEMRPGALPGMVRSKFANAIGTKNWKDGSTIVSEAISNATTDRITSKGLSLLSLVPGRPLFAELGKKLPSAQRYLRAKEEMDALRNEWQAKASDVAQKWIDLAKRDKASTDVMMDLMHRTTQSGIDPTKVDWWGVDDGLLKKAHESVSRHGDDAPLWAKQKISDERMRSKGYATLKAIYDGLPAEHKAMYVEVRDSYSNIADEFDTALEDNIKGATTMALKRAEKDHKRELRRIKDDGLTGKDLADAVAAADEALDKVKRRGGWGMKAKLASLRKVFESNRLQGPYFPMSRFGEYFVTVRDKDGKVTNFSRFETAAKQESFFRQQEAASPGRVTKGLMADKAALRDEVSPKFVADIEAMLGDSGVDPELMDAIWQRYLETMPDQSIRSSKIHRKGREGWNKDALRSYTSHMFHGAHQLARLKYGLELRDSLDDAMDEARQAYDPNRATALVNEMNKRLDWAMNPTGKAWSAMASSLAFVWYLGVSPAAAIVNISQTTLIGPGLMKAAFKKASLTGIMSELGKAAKDFGKGRGQVWTDTWSVENSPDINRDEYLAMMEGYRRGTIDKTQAHDLAAVAESGTEFNPMREKWMKKIGFFFHHAERFNREVTYLANYRLARADGLAHADAIEKAADLTWKIHFSYQNSDRPTVMQGDFPKLFLQFRQFTVNTLFRLFRDSHQSLYGATKEERAEARTQLIGVTLSMMAHAGIKGTWGYGIAMGLLALFFPGDADDVEEWMQDALLMEGDGLGVAAWNYTMGAALNGIPGHVLGANLSERIGSPNLWFRGSDRDLDGADLVQQYVNDTLGPTVGILFSMGRAADYLASGDTVRGIEAASPKFLRDVIKTGRYAADGVTTKNGDALIEDVSPWELIMQANGFTPARVAERYAINTRLKNKEQAIMDERKGLHRSVNKLLEDGQPISEKLMDQVRDFNRRFPEYPISSDSIRASFGARARAKGKMDSGITLNEKLAPRLRGDLAPTIYN